MYYLIFSCSKSEVDKEINKRIGDERVSFCKYLGVGIEEKL